MVGVALVRAASPPLLFFCLHGELLGSLSVLLLQCESQAFGSMSDVEATVLDTGEELVGADLVPADRLFRCRRVLLTDLGTVVSELKRRSAKSPC